MLRAPSQTLLRASPPQALLHPVTLHKDIHIHQLLDPLLPRQRLGTFPVATPQQIIHQQPIQPDPGPLVVLDVRQTGNLVQVLEMQDPLPGRLVEGLLFPVEAFHLALQALHAGDHRVEGRDRSGGVLAGQGGVGGRFERGEDVLVLPFDVLLNGFEILSGDFVRET